MNRPRKWTDLPQNPLLWAVAVGGILGLVLGVAVTGKMRLALTRGILSHMESRVMTLSRPRSKSQAWLDVDRLTALTLWGKGRPEEGGVPSPSGKTGPVPPKIHLGDLELKGIVRYPDGTFVSVFRDRKTQRSLFMREGEKVGGFKVLVIQPDRVVGMLKAKKMTFTLFQSKTKTAPARKGRSLNSTRQSPGGHRVVLPKKEVEAALGDMASFLRQVRIVPYLENGTPRGFQLLDIVPGSIVAKVGLKNGDVVEKVNGHPIRTPQDAMQFFSMLQSGSGVTMEIRRNRHPLRISVDLQ